MDQNKGWLERREFTRVRDVLKVFFYPLEDSSGNAANLDDYKDTTIEKLQSGEKKHSFIQAMTDDISKGGLSIISDKPLRISQQVIIDIILPKISKPVKLLAEVRNLDSNVKGSYKAGLKIISISKSDLTRIENYILSIPSKGAHQNG